MSRRTRKAFSASIRHRLLEDRSFGSLGFSRERWRKENGSSLKILTGLLRKSLACSYRSSIPVSCYFRIEENKCELLKVFVSWQLCGSQTIPLLLESFFPAPYLGRHAGSRSTFKI